MDRQIRTYPIVHAAQIAVLLLLGTDSPAYSDSSVVIDAWKKRQSAVHSARIEWKQTRYSDADFLPGPSPEELQRQSLPLIDGRGVVFQETSVLTFDLRRMKYFRDSLAWSKSAGEFVPQGYYSAFDGAQSRMLFPKGATEQIGFSLTKERTCQDAFNYVVAPVLIAVRPFDQVVGRFEPRQMRVIHESIVVAGSKCIGLLAHDRGGDSSTYEVFVDVDRDYVPLRVVFITPGGTRWLDIDIEYREELHVGWFPSRWTIRWVTNDGKLRASYDASANHLQRHRLI